MHEASGTLLRRSQHCTPVQAFHFKTIVLGHKVKCVGSQKVDLLCLSIWVVSKHKYKILYCSAQYRAAILLFVTKHLIQAYYSRDYPRYPADSKRSVWTIAPAGNMLMADISFSVNGRVAFCFKCLLCSVWFSSRGRRILSLLLYRILDTVKNFDFYTNVVGMGTCLFLSAPRTQRCVEVIWLRWICLVQLTELQRFCS